MSTTKVANVQTTPEGAVVVNYETLSNNPGSLYEAIAAAFGSHPDCLGILIVTGLPDEFKMLRERLLRLSDKFASLPHATREQYADSNSRYSFGWSHGKVKLKELKIQTCTDNLKEIMNGKPDLLKGSFYANPLMDDTQVPIDKRTEFPEYYGQNIWPRSSDGEIAGFEDAFKALGIFIFEVGRKLAAACQPFASPHLIDQSTPLSALISPMTTKARLLHYFPPSQSTVQEENEPVDSWCGFHLDHSLLTGLCSALYLSHVRSGEPEVCPPPSAISGLYIKTRGGKLVKVAIPADCLAFQTGEALELATNGQLRATPHCVRAGQGPSNVSRETFALFMQPDTEVKIGPSETFGGFSKRIFSDHYDKDIHVEA